MIEVNKINETFAILKCDRGIAQELSEYFSFFMEGYKFTPAFKNRMWDGKLRLAKLLPNGDVQFYIGLMHQLEIFCKDRDYSLNKLYKDNKNSITNEILSDFVEKLNIHSNGKSIDVRDYQFDGVLDFINTKRQVLISPTSSGKSLILYMIIRFLLKCDLKKILLIVPNTSLCHQLASDFADYSTHNSWDADKHIHLVFAGKDKDADKEIILSTWQSLYTIKDANYFKQFDVVINDECFSGEMEVLTKYGNTKIKDIKIGDIVLNYSEQTKEFKEDIVIDVFENLTKSNKEKMYKLEFDCGTSIEVTGNHKFLTDLGWVRADELTYLHNIISYDETRKD